MGVYGLGQLSVDAVRAAHRVVARAVRVGASAPHAHIHLAAQLGLYVAHERQVARCPPLQGGEVLGRLVEPVRIAVQHDAHVALLGCHQAVHRIERKRVAVQAAHHVQHVARNLGIAGEGVGGQAVVDRADPARVLEHPAHLAGHGA